MAESKEAVALILLDKVISAEMGAASKTGVKLSVDRAYLLSAYKECLAVVDNPHSSFSSN